MSQETIEWLNRNVLYGFVGHRDKWEGNGFMMGGKAWWANDGFGGAYTEAVPVEDVEERLFDWEAQSKVLLVEEDALPGTSEYHESGVVYRKVAGYQGIARSDSGYMMGIFKEGYQIHQFRDWLLQNVANIIDGRLGIASAGLLRGGAVAWVSVELPEDIDIDTGGAPFTVRPSLLACTSHDGSLATGYKLTDLIPVCDNSLTSALSGEGNRIKYKHTRYSQGRIAEARDALGMIYKETEAFQDMVQSLAHVDVSDAQFKNILYGIIPVPAIDFDKKGKVSNQKSITMAENKHAALTGLWTSDPRVQPWRNSGLGVLQAFNTFTTWETNTRGRGSGGAGLERMMLRTIKGEQDEVDKQVVAQLLQVTGATL